MAPGHAAGFLLSAAAGLVLGACGGGGTSPGPTSGSARAEPVVPAISKVSRTLPASTFGRDAPFLRNGCVQIQVGPGVGPPPTCRPTRETLAGLPRGPQSPVRLLAELRLKRPQGLSQRALFAVYQSRRRGTCFSIVFEVRLDPLSCDSDARCPQVCLQPFVEERSARLGVPATGRYTLLAGTVRTGAKAVRMEFRGGEVLTYALRGPAARGFPGRRIFMVDLGRRSPPARVRLVG